MNGPTVDPLQGGFPEVIDTYLEYGVMKCIAFNRRGTLLAAGCSDGRCVVWDFQTRGIAKELKNNDRVAAITSVCWSKTGHHILVSASDNSLTLWNVSKGEKVFQTILQQTHLQARLHPGGSGGSSPPSLCLVTSSSSAPFILDFRTQITTVLPISSPDNTTHNFSDGSSNYTPTEACFNKSGDLVYLGNSIGEILIIDYKNNKVCGIVQIPGGAAIKNIVFSRNGQHILTNSSDRIIRVYENLLPLKDAHKFFDGNESVGLKCLSLLREFQDSVTKVHWKAPCFSGDGEWVVGGSASKGEHKIYVWDRDGLLVKLLDGPKEALVDLAWHPAQPIVVSVSLTGLVYIWVKDYTENWSVFAPDFRELDKNEEYVEQEDEFDLMPETEKVKGSCLNEDDEVDIITVEKESTFSDSDISQEELCYLPAHPCPDIPEKLLDSNNVGSPLSNDSSETDDVENYVVEYIGGARGTVMENSVVEYTGWTRGTVVDNSVVEYTGGARDTVVENSLVEYTDGARDTVVENSLVEYTDGARDTVVENSLVEYTGGTRDAVVESSVVEYTGGTRDAVVESSVVEYTGGVRDSVVENSLVEYTGGTHDAVVETFLVEYTGGTRDAVVESSVVEYTGGTRDAVAESSALEYTGGTLLKRKRKRSKKLLELQDIKDTQKTILSDCSYKESFLTPDCDLPMPEQKKTKSKSMVWNHFEKLQKSDKKVAVCNYCGANFVSENAGTTHLWYHLRGKHAEVIVPEECNHIDIKSTTDDNESMTEYEEVEPASRRKKRSEVWNYYKKFTKRNNKSVAACNFCQRRFVSGPAGTHHLWNHVKRKHAKEAELVVSTNK
ncbi:putative transcription factor WD40-like family [Helianthus debilis subsp. tardiflorus]